MLLGYRKNTLLRFGNRSAFAHVVGPIAAVTPCDTLQSTPVGELLYMTLTKMFSGSELKQMIKFCISKRVCLRAHTRSRAYMYHV